MTEAEEAFVDLNIKTHTNFLCLPVEVKTVVDLKYINRAQSTPKPFAKFMMYENDSVFCEISTDTAVTRKGLLSLSCLSA
jgi:hypothetical protein